MRRKLLNAELERKTVAGFKSAEKTPLVIVLDNIRSAHNVGSVFRTADAFLIESIYLCGITVKPPNKDIRKTALGASDSMEWHYFEQTVDAIAALKAKGYQIIAIEQADQKTWLQDFETTTDAKYALVFGHEVKGVSAEVVEQADFCVEIPQFGTKHSLNIAVSVGVVIWDFFKSLTKSN